MKLSKKALSFFLALVMALTLMGGLRLTVNAAGLPGHHEGAWGDIFPTNPTNVWMFENTYTGSVDVTFEMLYKKAAASDTTRIAGLYGLTAGGSICAQR